MKRVCIFTGTRAEYGLLKPLMERIRQDNALELSILSTAMHLSPEFGWTFRQIEADGFKIDEKVETLMSSDTPQGICKSMGLGLIGFCDALERIAPDILILLGDRFEAFAAAATAMILRIPVAHLYGGEATQGVIDESIRHSITKMSHLHFTATEDYRRRVIQLGEHPDRVFNVGALGVENIKQMVLMDRREFEDSLGFNLRKRYFLVTFHPVTLERATSKWQFCALLSALDHFSECNILFTKGNADTEGRVINDLILRYVAANPKRAAGFDSLGQIRYLSAMKHAVAVVGNSSSGIIEAPSLSIPTVNIGDRQSGRIKANSIIDCQPNEQDILSALKRALSPEFKIRMKDVKNPYEGSDTSFTIKEIIKEHSLDRLLMKRFYDLNW